MNFISKKINMLRYVFAALLFVSLSCTSDNGSEDLGGESSLSFEIDGKLWTADNAMVQTLGGEQWEEELYAVSIVATKGINEASDGSDIETFSLHFYVDNSNFNNPKGIYPVPPPEAKDTNDAGYGLASFASLITNNYYFSIDPENEIRRLGEATITNYEIGSQFILGDGYVYLSGTFQFKIFGVNRDTGELTGETDIKSGKFNVRAPKIGL